MSFFKELVTANSGISSKRFTSLFSLFLLAGMVIVDVCGLNVPEVIYYVLSGLILGSSGMTLVQK